MARLDLSNYCEVFLELVLLLRSTFRITSYTTLKKNQLPRWLELLMHLKEVIERLIKIEIKVLKLFLFI